MDKEYSKLAEYLLLDGKITKVEVIASGFIENVEAEHNSTQINYMNTNHQMSIGRPTYHINFNCNTFNHHYVIDDYQYEFFIVKKKRDINE